ncbi:MAG: hypothetical protein AABZ60_03315 [Planctomycetota bacterium]
MGTNPLSISSFKKIRTLFRTQTPLPKAALITFFLVLGLEVVFKCLPEFVLDQPDFVNTWIRWKQTETRKPNCYKTLFLGECFGMTAFKPVIYDTISRNAPSFNLCVYQRNTFLSLYYLLKKYLDSAKSPPDQVILEFMEITLYDQTPLDENQINQHILPYLEHDKELWQELNLWVNTSKMISFPCWKRPMKGVLSRIWNWKTQKQQFQIVWNLFQEQRGFYPLGRKEVPDLSLLGNLPQSVKEGKFSKHNRYYLEKILDLLQQQKISVLLIVPCLRKDRRWLWIRYQVGTHYGKYLQELKQKYSQIVAIEAYEFVNLFPNVEDFQDSNHLTEASSEKFTRKLAEWVNQLPEKK